MKKFSNFYKFFLSLALVLVVGFIPTTAKASVDKVPENVIPKDDYRVYVQVQYLSYGVWTNALETVVDNMSPDTSYVFNIDAADVDRTTGDNIRFRIYYEFRTSSDYSYVINDYFEAGIEYDDFYLSNFRMNVYGALTDDVFYSLFAPLYSNVAFSGSGYPTYEINLDSPGGFAGIMVEFATNMHESFPSTVNGQAMQGYFMYGDETVWRSENSSIPSVDSPDVDSFPDIDEYIPDNLDTGFMSCFNLIINQPYIVVCLFIVSVVGIVAFVIFGKKA